MSNKEQNFTKNKRERTEEKTSNIYKKNKDIKSSSRTIIEKILDDTEKDQKNTYNITEEIKTKNDKKQKIDSLSRFTMDSEGRIIDDKGNILSKPTHKSTLMININKEKELRVKELLKNQKADQKMANKINLLFYDSTLDKIKKKRNKQNAFNFIEQGSYEKKIESLRIKYTAKQLGLDLNSTQLTEEEERDLSRQDILFRYTSRQPIKLRAIDLIPDVEWWDAVFLLPDKKSFSPYWIKDENGNDIHKLPKEIKFEDFIIDDSCFLKDKINIYIQHPVPIKNEHLEKINRMNLPVFLTVKERKRIRKLRRVEKEKDKQEKIKLGLIKPPEPKLKFNNFMRILGDEAIQDPSQIEKKVRKAYEDRYKKMMKENESRKLTKEQKAEKIKRKFERDSKKEVRACLFKIEDLTDRRNRFKVNRTSQQLYLTGLCLIKKKRLEGNFPNLVYVEGGPLAIRRYKNLLLRRINWDKNKIIDNENNIDDNNDSEYVINPKCLLVWEGTLKKRYFDKWKTTEFRSEIDAKKTLSERGLEHFWNLVISYNN